MYEILREHDYGLKTYGAPEPVRRRTGGVDPAGTEKIFVAFECEPLELHQIEHNIVDTLEVHSTPRIALAR